MLLAYILGKDRRWRCRLVKKRHEGLFKSGSFEYEVHPECVYNRKVLGFKLVQCIDYIEGVRKPVRYEFDSGITSLITSEIPLDEIAMVVSRALKNILILIACICSVGAMLISLITLIKVLELTGGA